MKRRWRFLLAIMLASLIVLAACGSNSGDNEESSADGDEITLKFVHWIDDEVGNWESVIEKYEEENPGIKIESESLVNNMSFQDYLKQLDLMVSAGEKVDMMMFANPFELQKRVESGMVEPLNGYLDEEEIDFDEIYHSALPVIDENHYGLPMKNNISLVVLNKDHLDEAGLEVPDDWTWDDYREYAKELTTDDHFGSYLHITHANHSLLQLIGKKESDAFLKADGTSNIDNPLVRESLEYRYTLESEDKTSTPLAEIMSQQMDYRQQFFSEKASMLPMATYMVTEWGSFTPDFTMAWAPMPKYSNDETSYAPMAGDGISIAKNSDHKQEAYDFIRWMSTEGIVDQGIWLPSWKEADLDEVLSTMVEGTSNPDAVDLESLKNAISVRESGDPLSPVSHYLEANNAFTAEVELYLLGEQDLDTTIEVLKDKIGKIVEKSQ